MNHQIQLAGQDAWQQIKAGDLTGKQAIDQFKAALMSACLSDPEVRGNQSLASRELELNRATVRRHAGGKL